jgi:large subunit ribosomal protein L6
MVKLEIMEREVDVPDGVKVTMDKGILLVEGSKGKLRRKFDHPRVKMQISEGRIKVKCDKPVRVEMGLVGTWASHAEGMIRGVTHGYRYQMRIIYSHFPVKTSVKGNELVIENFLGERHPRKARILPDVTAKISGDTITLEGINREHVGQTAANIEKSTLVKNYDPRVFQDGIYLISRGE